MEEITKIKEKFSYSKLDTYDKKDGCPYKFKLKYRDKHFPDETTLANEFGTLVHYIEETIAKDIVNNNNEPIFMIDNDKYLSMFRDLNIKDEDGHTVLGVKQLKEKYDEKHFTEKDKFDLSYDAKIHNFEKFGIYSLQNYLSEHREMQLVGIEQGFELEHKNYIFHGFIDRAYRNIETGEIYVEDIKTWSNISGHELKTPLQLVLYSLAASYLWDTPLEKISCGYDLLLTDGKHPAGTKGYINRGIKKIDTLLEGIEANNYVPNPSPLCHWCVFSSTYIEGQPEDAKGLCPYYSHWTKKNHDMSVEYEWAGLQAHDLIMQDFQLDIEKQKDKKSKIEIKNVYIEYKDINKDKDRRRFLIRR